MVESKSTPPNPNSSSLLSTTSDPPPLPPVNEAPTSVGDNGKCSFLAFPKGWGRRPEVRVATEYDSDTSVFFHKISCKLFGSLAKLKLAFQNNNKSEISEPQLTFTSKYLSLHYDLEEHNALLNVSFTLAPGFQLKAAHDVKAQQGEVAMVVDLAGPAYKFELLTAVPAFSLPKATLKFPVGEVSFEEKDEEEETANRILSINGIVKGPVLNGICTAQLRDENLNLRYSFEDEQMTFIPSISLPSNALSVAFKRNFSPSDKLSYCYNFDSNYWSAVYKHTIGKDFKFKAGYDSEVRLAWASLWVGDEDGKAKTAPMKMKMQFMLQVPQDDIKSTALMFRVKKRWDI